MSEITVKSHSREEMIDVTDNVRRLVDQSGVDSGFVFCYVPHTTAGITINENADPDVPRDILYKLHEEIPYSDNYHHREGNADAHIKASLIGSSEQLLIENGKLVLGHWQGIFFCEFDGPRSRRLIIRITPVA
jgi:secondary thiamine-phosphate synthase enzyme